MSTDKFMDYLGATFEGLLGASSNPAKDCILGAGKQLRNVNIAGIWSTTGRWLVRVDKPHGKVGFFHININPRVTGVPDPHVPISESTARAFGTTSNAIKTASDYLGYIVVAVEAFRIGKSVYEDSKHSSPMEETMKTTTSVAGGLIGGKCGAIAGSTIGSKVGGLIGFVIGFGPVGGVVGAAVGSMVGGVGGGVAGAQVGRQVAEENYKYVLVLDASINGCTLLQILDGSCQQCA